MDIVCFPGVLFDKLPWTNRQRIMLEFAQRHRVLYVEPPKLPALQVFKAIARVMPEQRSHRWFRRVTKAEERAPGLSIFSQVAYVPERSRRGRRLNAAMNARMLGRELQRLRMWNPLVWAYTPDAIAVIERLGLSRIVFDVVDDYPSQPYYRRHLHGIEEDQIVMATRASVIFSSARAMQRKLKEHNERCFYAGNAADFEHFAAAQSDSREPEDIAHLGRPRIAFVGAMDDYKVDVELVEAVATRCGRWEFILIGPSGVAGGAKQSRTLGTLPNVHLLGPRPYAAIPAYLGAVDACIIPYRLNRYTESCFPLKFFEFLATGRPVVSTPLPELKPYASVARLAATADEFVRELAAALEDHSSECRDARIGVAREHTWNAKARRMERIVRELGV